MVFCGLNMNALWGHRYQVLPGNGNNGDPFHEKSRVSFMIKSVAKRFAVLLLLIIFALTVCFVSGITPTTSYFQTHSELPPDTKSLHILVPSNQKQANLAKTLVSAAICGFPMPTIINWGITYNAKKLFAGGAHLAKITGTLSYLDSLPPSADGDLVLLIDGYDIWFQLHPSVLIDRYHRINADANRRIRNRMGKQAAIDHNIYNNVVISAQKRCWPRDDKDSSCWAVPQSTLPSKIYGPQTDKKLKSKGKEYTKMRPRFLNSGVIMGDVAHMRALFQQALEKMNFDRNIGSDQNIFADIFGKQEFQRELLREQYLGSWARFWRWLGIGDTSSVLDDNPRHHKPARWEEGAGGDFEFGVGIDYESLLGHTTAFSEFDTEWLHLDDPTSIQAAKDKYKVSTNYQIRLPSDIAASEPPFPSNAEDYGLPANVTWMDLSLHTNLYTSNVPAMVHLNGRLNKYLREKDWHKIWFQPYARTLLDAYLQGKENVFAVTVEEDGQETQWVGVKGQEDRTVIKTFGEDGAGVVEWEDLLNGFEDEVFRDEIGVWGDSKAEEDEASKKEDDGEE